MNDFMRATDAFSWYMERDPILRSTVVAVVWLDGTPDWEVLESKADAASRLVPLFRKKLLQPPLRLSTPRWTLDEAFDISSHVRRISAPEPRSDATVLEFARMAAMTSFDAARPLWDFTLIEGIEGVEGGRSALVMKIHHSLTDGIGGMQLALLLFDRERSQDRVDPMPEAPRCQSVGTATLVRQSFAHNLESFSGVAASWLGKGLPSLRRLTTHPIGTVSAAADTVRSIGRTVAPVLSTLSPIMTKRGMARSLDMLEVSLDDLKRAVRTCGGSVNDGFVASVTGGLRRYHERHDSKVDTLRMTLPISIRTPTDPMGGNRITLIRFPLHGCDLEPASRVAEADIRCGRARRERSLGLTNAIAGALNLLPSGVVGSMLKHVDFLASDVPGFDFPVYLGGAMVQRYVTFGPTIGSSVNFTLLSYNGTCFVGMTIDSAAVPDADVLVECVREGFEEVLDLGGEHLPVRHPLREPVPAQL